MSVTDPPDRRPAPARPARRTGALGWALDFGVRAAGAVAIVQFLLLVPLTFGWIGLSMYAVTSAVISGVVVGAVSWRTARVLNNVRSALGGFWQEGDDGPSQAAANGSWDDLEADLNAVRDRTLRRLSDLKRTREAALKQSQANRRIADHLRLAQRIARVGSWEWERNTGRLICSQEVHRLLYRDPASFRLTPATLLALVHPEDRRAFRRWVVRMLRGTEPHGFDMRMRGPEDEVLHLHVLGEVQRADRRTVRVVGTIQDATERTHAIQQIHRLAYYDVLTELPNRSRFHEKLAETLDLAKRQQKAFAIMFLDLDQFKRINDTMGHAAGDDLLRIVAQRLTRVLRMEEVGVQSRGKGERDVCRQGGDEFIVLLNGVGTEEHASRVANRVIETLAQPIALAAQEVFVSASIGIVLFPRDGDDLDTLLKNADVAMYHAKAEGRNRYAFYHDSMRAATARRLSLESDLRRAIEGEQFVLHYQPQIDVSTGRITGLEALVRWNHPVMGLLWPQHFIRVAEEAGLIMAIWEWVFVAALIQHNAWRQEGLPPMTIGVNLSSVQFSDTGLAARVQEIAQVVGVPLDHVEFEVTESALMRDFDNAFATLKKLRGMGVKIAIDDFGTGYSSLSYLRRLPLDKLKLDHAFTSDAVDSVEGAAISRAIIAMAHSLRLDVVAEGVETQQQIDALTDMGCTTMQGYLLSRPLDGQAMTDLLQRHFRSDSMTQVDYGAGDAPQPAGSLPGAIH